MSEWISPIQLTVAVVALAIAVVSLYVANWWRVRKGLAFRIETVLPVVSYHVSSVDDLQVTYKGKPIADVRLFIFTLYNSGNQPIVIADFQRPLALEFGPDTRILSCEVVKQHPTNFEIPARIDRNRLEFSSSLLNKGDRITFKAMLSTPRVEVRADARITGISMVVVNETTDKINAFFTPLYILLLTAVGILILAKQDVSFPILGFLGAISPILVFGFIAAVRKIQRRGRKVDRWEGEFFIG